MKLVCKQHVKKLQFLQVKAGHYLANIMRFITKPNTITCAKTNIQE